MEVRRVASAALFHMALTGQVSSIRHFFWILLTPGMLK